MPTAVATEQSIPSPGEIARVWALHCLSFVLPVTCLAYLLGGLHVGWHAAPWLLVLIGSVVVDMWSPAEERQPAATLRGWPFDAVLYVLAALHLVIVALLVDARRAPRLLDLGHVRRAHPRRRQLRLLGHRRGARADPPQPGASPSARPRAARQRALRALLHRAPARPSRAGRHRRGRGHGALRRVRHALFPPHGAGAVSQRVAARVQPPG